MTGSTSFTKSLHHVREFCVSVALLALVVVSLAAVNHAGAATSGKAFSSPEEAVSALATALDHSDTNALTVIFGPLIQEIKSPDPVQAKQEFHDFIARFNASNHVARVQDDLCTLEIGQDRWPFAIPIVRTNGSWFFDTQAGKQEIQNRRIGENELQALKSVRAAAQAQREYASADRDGDEVLEYAQKFVSTPGTKDGLYWPPELDGEISPLGPAFVAAQQEGYVKDLRPGTPPQPFHGYLFKILTRQAKHAPGGAYDYIINGNMIGGFAFVAWPVRYADSGIMTFIINQQGRVYQKDLGPDTDAIVGKMKEYDPDPSWTISPD
jgi:hypothetical protein